MTPIVVATSIALLAGDPLTARIQDANAAAEALQGSFDGAWILTDAKGAIVYWLQLTDPPNGRETVVGAWRDADGRMGATQIERVGRDRIHLVIESDRLLWLVLVRTRGAWRGAAAEGSLTLSRSLATSGPAV